MTSYAPLLQRQEDHQVLFLDPRDAVKLVDRLRKVKFFIRSNVDLVTHFNDQGQPTKAYMGMGGNIPVSASVARKMLVDLAQFNERKAQRGDPEGQVEVARYGDCVFFG